jgi:predicted MFS family arabinose efflux permease
MLGDRAVRRVALARFISATGGEAAFFVGVWGRAAYDFSASPGQLALLMGVLGLAGLAGSAAGGILVDRFGPRRVLVLGEAVLAPCALLPAFVTDMPSLVVTVAAGTFVNAVGQTAIGSIPPFLIDAGPQRLAQANAAMEIGTMFSAVSGPAVGALVAGYADLRWIFPFDALTSVAAVLLVARIPVRVIARQGGDGDSSVVAELREGIRFAYSVPLVRFTILGAATVFMSFAAFGSLEPLFYRDVLHTGPQAIGLVNMVFGAGLGAGALFVHRFPRALASVRALTVLSVASGLGAVLYAGTADLRVVVVGAVLWGAILGALLPAVRTILQLHTPDELIGRAMGALNVHQGAGELLPLMAVPVMAAAWGVQPVLVGSGAGLALVAAVALPLASALDRGRERERMR